MVVEKVIAGGEALGEWVEVSSACWVVTGADVREGEGLGLTSRTVT